MSRQTADELLCYCLAGETDETKAARLERLSASDWDGILQRSARHGVSALLYRRLRTFREITTPIDLMNELQKRYLESSGSSMRLYHQLAQVLAVLQDDGIPVIVLKGAHLAEVVYGNTALRPMSDIDLLVRKADVLRAGEKLLEIGYVPFNRLWHKAVEAAHHHLPPFYKQNAPPVELHWTIMRVVGLSGTVVSPFCMDVGELWKRARPTSIAGVQVFALSPEHLLLHLCLHVSHHHGFRVSLRDFCDIAHTIQHYRDEMDWGQVQVSARQWKADKCVYLTLRLAQGLLEAAVPDEVLDVLAPDDFDPRFVMWAREQLFAERDRGVPDMYNLARVQDAPLLRKAAIGFKTVFPSRKAMATLYPVSPRSKRVYLYYLVRLRDLFLKYGRLVWQMFRRDKKTMAVVEHENRANALIDWMISA